MSAIEFQLKPSELLICAMAGAMRRVAGMKYDRKEKNKTLPEGGWQRDIEGCIGEYIVSKHLGKPWSGIIDVGSPDVGNGEQVRTGMKLSHQHLILHDYDEDDARFWFVSGQGRRYLLHGWMRGRDGKQKKYWGDPFDTKRPAFWIPASDLTAP